MQVFCTTRKYKFCQSRPSKFLFQFFNKFPSYLHLFIFYRWIYNWSVSEYRIHSIQYFTLQFNFHIKHLLIFHFVYLYKKKLSTVSHAVFLPFTKGTIYVFSVFSSIVQIMLFTLFTYFPLGSYTVKQYCYIILAFLNESKLFIIAFLALLLIKLLLSY